jgi:PEGA domain-containing protein
MMSIRTFLGLLLGFVLLLGSAYAAPKPAAEKKPPPNKTGISWKVAPANVIIFLDGKKVGEAGALTFTETKPGKHGVKLTKGKDETEMEVNVKKGEVVSFEFEFTE